MYLRSGPCPDIPIPLIVERGSGTSWMVNQLEQGPPHRVASSAAWGAIGESVLYVGTSGGGAYRGDVSWD